MEFNNIFEAYFFSVMERYILCLDDILVEGQKLASTLNSVSRNSIIDIMVRLAHSTKCRCEQQ